MKIKYINYLIHFLNKKKGKWQDPTLKYVKRRYKYKREGGGQTKLLQKVENLKLGKPILFLM